MSDCAPGGLDVLPGAVAATVEGVLDGVARLVGHRGQAACRVIGIGGVRAIGQGDLLEQSGQPVVHADDLIVRLAGIVAAACLDSGQPASGVELVVGSYTVAVAGRHDAAGAVVTQHFKRSASKGILDLPQVALPVGAGRRRGRAGALVVGVIEVTGDVRHLGAWAIYGQRQAFAWAGTAADIDLFAIAIGNSAQEPAGQRDRPGSPLVFGHGRYTSMCSWATKAPFASRMRVSKGTRKLAVCRIGLSGPSHVQRCRWTLPRFAAANRAHRNRNRQPPRCR